MIVLIGKAKIQPDKRVEFLAAIAASTAAGRQEPGNLSYGWFQSTEIDNEFVVIEEWESEAAMSAHLTSAHAATFLQLLSTVVTEPPQLHRYDTPTRQVLPL